MVFWKRELRDLAASQHRFEDIFHIFSEEFTDTPFSEQYRAGRTIRMSYGELTALTNRIARVLHARFAGSEGAFLALRMENSPLWVAAFFGVLQAGFRPLLLNLRLDEQTLRQIAAGAAAVLTDHPEEGCFDLSDCGDAPEFTPCWANEIALMTSGTTGQSKLILYGGEAMTYLLIGGSKSGKSHLAQQLCRSLGGPLVYWATMEPVDGEDRARIENHLRDREGWGFETLEAARELPAAFDRLPADATVLFDSATALLANEMFRPDGTMDKDAGARSAQELLALARSCRHLVCVCDDLWRDGQDYDPWTEEYRRRLAGICRKLAAEFDAVAEVICGLPQFYKHGKDVI